MMIDGKEMSRKIEEVRSWKCEKIGNKQDLDVDANEHEKQMAATKMQRQIARFQEIIVRGWQQMTVRNQ